MTHEEYEQAKCPRHIWAAPRYSVIQPEYRKDGMKLTHPGVACKFCGMAYNKLSEALG